jgi:hypothetical protein
MHDIQGVFTEEEIDKVIQGWPTNKMPGPDGYTGEFLKKFKATNIPDLL